MIIICYHGVREDCGGHWRLRSHCCVLAALAPTCTININPQTELLTDRSGSRARCSPIVYRFTYKLPTSVANTRNQSPQAQPQTRSSHNLRPSSRSLSDNHNTERRTSVPRVCIRLVWKRRTAPAKRYLQPKPDHRKKVILANSLSRFLERRLRVIKHQSADRTITDRSGKISLIHAR